METAITAKEIKEIRGMYGLTQKSFATLLGIGPASMVRYEQGSVPSKANANLIRAARHPEFMRECIEREGSLIPQKQRDEAMRCTYAYVKLDEPEEEEMKPQNKMNEIYHYTIQQEVLNEQAANLVCDLITYSINNGLDTSDKTHPISAMISQLLDIKRFLVTYEADDDAVLEQIRGHLRYTGQIVEAMSRAEEVA